MAAGVAVLAVTTIHLVKAESVQIVVPNAFADVEGDVGVLSSGGFWFQQLLMASEFDAVPESHRTLTGIYHRPDKSVVGQPGTVTYNDLRTQLSTTSKGPAELTGNPASNRGNDVTTVFDGSITVTTNNMGPANGPRDFDYYFPFSIPFTYDPSAGNLLLEVYSSSGAIGGPIYDGFTSSSPRGVNGLTGALVNGGFVFQFDIVDYLDGDFNKDQRVDGRDFLLWQRGESPDPLSSTDLAAWQTHYGQSDVALAASSSSVPEPSSLALMCLVLLSTGGFCKMR